MASTSEEALVLAAMGEALDVHAVLGLCPEEIAVANFVEVRKLPLCGQNTDSRIRPLPTPVSMYHGTSADWLWNTLRPCRL